MTMEVVMARQRGDAFPWLLGTVLSALVLGGCLQTRHEVEVKPMHITVDVNVRIQNELKKEFREQDEAMRQISDAEAAAALERYLKELGG